MKKNLCPLALFLNLIVVLQTAQISKVFSQSSLPVPAHIVIVIDENKGYNQIIGSSSAPHINALASDPSSALFTQSYALFHPSQPNYLELFSGSNQGVTTDNVPSNNPFTTANLARQLINAGKTYTTFSEDLPSMGYNGATSGNYARKHNPEANWMGTGTNQIPTTTNQPFTAFPSSNFAALPTVCLVIGNLIDDMHSGNPEVSNGDTWLYNNLYSYIQWAKTHNSLFIFTFDEDEGTENQRITTIFTGQMVAGGQYANTINHYNVLRTIEEMYGLPYAGNASTATAITNCWIITGINNSASISNIFTVYPNPSNGDFTIQVANTTSSKLEDIEIFNVYGEKVFEEMNVEALSKEMHLKNILAGIYLLKVKIGENIYIQKLIIRQ
jgi:hypothetical protein